MLNQLIKYFLNNKLVTLLLTLLLVGWGLTTAPFKWEIPFLPSDPVPVDAIPDIGENQQIVFTEWMGRSPQDVEDQITYPLTTAMLGMPGVKSIRSTSMFGFSSIYVIFKEDVEYYWSRSRILEKLNALPAGLLPEEVQPRLGPDATALGQVYWYTLEGRDKAGKPAGGWDLHELRSIQDYYVRYALTGSEGVSEVATVGGYIKEYQVDLDPNAMKANNISMMEVMEALRKSNRDVGANTVEINQVEYLVRGLGYVKKIEDIEDAVVRATNNVPIRIKDIAKVNIGPAERSMLGILDKSGAEAVGGVVIARYGDNPLAVIENVKKKIAEIAAGLPEKKLEDGRTSKVTIVPFYDRTQLIQETLGTLNDAITLQILITIIVIMVMVYNLRASLLIATLLPLAVLMCFIFMRYFGVDANIVALSGIAIAIGTMVDLGIILNENILKKMDEAPQGQPLLKTVYEGTTEVATAILTAVATTIVSFIPVFTLQAAEGKLFGPLAWTKTFALVAALIFTLVIMPAFSHLVFGINRKKQGDFWKRTGNYLLAAVGVTALFILPLAGVILILLAANNLLNSYYPERYARYHTVALMAVAVAGVSWLLAEQWVPLGVKVSTLINFLFIVIIVGVTLGMFTVFIRYYPKMLGWCLANKKKFLLLPALIILFGGMVWLGFDKLFGWSAAAFDKLGWNIRTTSIYSGLSHTFPAMGKEFMPSLDEGAFLLMPTSMPHSGVEANKKILQQLDMLVTAIPEVETVVGKAGRAETALDPAPMSMFENVILYKPEYKTDAAGRKMRFKTDKKGDFVRDEQGELIADKNGAYHRQWRDHIHSPDDIWNEIVKVTNIPGVTSAPKLQPIETRLVMLQTGMRAPMGLKVYGPDLKTIEDFSLELENILKEVPSVKPEAVFADRSLGKPYLEIDLDRKAISRYGLNVDDLQEYIEVALGGMAMTTTVEGRERYSIRARYAREFRNDPEAIKRVVITTSDGGQVPLSEMAEVIYRPGPMMIRSEESFLVGYVLLDKKEGFAEVTVVADAQRYINSKIKSGELNVPQGVSFKFSGSYENQVRAEERLALVIPLCLIIIFLILYFQFRSVATSMFIFTAIAMAFAGGFLMLWLYAQSWFMNFDFLGTNMRELFQMRQFNLSVAVWVGFIALFGIATDDGVVMATYLKQRFEAQKINNRKQVRQAVLQAGMRRVRPCLMTTATTLLALLPVLSSSGKGADIMIPMAIPAFGGMTVALITLFIVPVLYSWWEERKVGDGREI
ncbi:efflux RND transporter permease subunit [Parapedobacter tibetensis]|uniref:efflux RND transporter permease subunit n=1 Tax=Parapedobacter tibetensis TaxID=2972951 RepID=UPI00214DCAE3|nr:efflux RND transporter permease subunit [Parapedobacter tibetensis]